MGVDKKSLLILAVIILIFALIQAPGLNHTTLGDEHAYFYMGKLISEGSLPYKDFFFAHPPIQIMFFAVIFKIFGFNLIMLKSVALLANILSAIFLFKITKRYSLHHAAISTILFLFTYTIMTEATYAYGIEIATTFTLISFYYLQKNNPIKAGIFYTIATLTALQSLILLPAILLYLFLKKNKTNLVKFSITFFAIFIIINLLLTLTLDNYFTDVYKFHLIKPKLEGDSLGKITDFIINNWFLSVSFIIFFALSKLRRFYLFLFPIIIYLLFLLISNRIFDYYFIILIPFLSILASQGILNLTKKIKGKHHIIAGFLAIIFLIPTISTTIYLQKTDFQNFQSLNELTNFIKTNSKESDQLFGDLYTTPMLSLYTERKIAFNFVDTNGLRFLSNLPPIERVINQLKQEKTKFIIIRPDLGISTSPELHKFVTEECKIAKQVNDPVFGEIIIFDCQE